MNTFKVMMNALHSLPLRIDSSFVLHEKLSQHKALRFVLFISLDLHRRVVVSKFLGQLMHHLFVNSFIDISS